MTICNYCGYRNHAEEYKKLEKAREKLDDILITDEMMIEGRYADIENYFAFYISLDNLKASNIIPFYQTDIPFSLGYQMNLDNFQIKLDVLDGM